MATNVFTTYDADADPTGTGLTQALLGKNSNIVVQSGSVTLSASAPSAVNVYDGSLALGIGAGLLLTSGTAPGTVNTVGWFGQDNTQYAADGTPVNFFNGDPAIDAVVNTVFQTQSYDATRLGFSFTVSDPDATSVNFDIVFGTDEYPEWVDQFVDCAVVIVNGVNYALFNHDPNAPLSVIGPNLAAGYFQDNGGNVLPIEYDGVSHVLKIVAPIKRGEVNSILIGIADTGDHIYDSGIFIANMSAGTTPGSGVVITPDVPCTDSADVVTGSVADELIDLLGGDDTAYAGGGDDIVLGGAGNDTIYGGSGNDVLEGDAGDDHLDGGEGTQNKAVYACNSADCSLTYDAASGTYTVTGPQGVDTLKSIQLVEFANGLFDLTPDGLSPHSAGPGLPGNQAGSVAVSGAAMVGQTLTAIVVDADGVPPGSVTYDWLTSTDGSTWTSTGVSTQTYTLAEGDVGLRVKVSVGYVDQAGHVEAPASAPLTVASQNGIAISLVLLSAPAGAGVENPLTTLLNNALALGFSANQAALAIKTVLALPDVSLLTYDPVALLDADPNDATALQVLKICGELAMAASASDPSVFNLTLAVMDAAAQGQTINLADPNQLATLLEGIGATELDIVQTTNKDMADAPNVAKAMAAWNDFCGNTDGMEAYQNSFGYFNVDLNQAPVGYSTAVLPFGSADSPYTIDPADLLAGFSDPDGDPLSVVDLVPNAGGTVTDNGDGTWTFTPDAGFVGPVELSFTVSDPSGATTTGNTMLVIAGPDVPPPDVTVSAIAYGTHDGTLKAGETVTLTVSLSEAVTVTGSASIALANGGTATYTGGSGSSTLTFSYTAAAGQDTADLRTATTGALSGTLTDAAGNAVATAGFDDVNPAGTLAVDTTAPTVGSIAYGTHDGTLKAGETVELTVSLSEAVTVTGTPSIALANGGTATYTGGSGSSALTFSYTAAAGQDTTDLKTLATGALSGTLTDAAGNAVTAGGFDDVNPAGTLAVDTIAPAVVTFSPADGSTGAAAATNIVVTFAEAIARGAGTIAIRQGSATGALVESFDAATSSRLGFSGAQLTIDPSNDLALGTNYFVVFAAGSVADAAGNAYAGLGTYDFTTAPAGNVITGTANADTLAGTAAIDFIYGLAGNDVITGAAATDFLDGGENSDIYMVASSTDHLAAEFADTGTSGTDEVRFSASSAGTLTLYADDTGIERAVLGTGTASAAVTTATTASGINASALSYGITLVGNAGNNVLTGGAGDDTLLGGAGNDTLNGGAGFDYADYSTATSTITANLSLATAQNTGGAGSDTLSGIEGLKGGSAADKLTGNGGDNVLVGNAGNDVLNGGAGNDTLQGGTGADTFTVTADTDTVTDLGNGGADILNVSAGATVNATVTTAWTASSSTVNKGTANISTSGLAVNLAAVTSTTAGNLGYRVTNTGAATTLTGSALGDWLTGGTGNDVLVGGLGNDVLDGRDGSDIYMVSLAAHHVAAEFADSGTSGTDEVRFSASSASTLTLYAGDTGIERAVLGTGTSGAAVTTATTGNSINASALSYGITLIGNAGANALTGGAGDDTLRGGAGNDTLNGGAGFDYADYSTATTAVTVNLGLTIAQNTGGAGSDTLSGIEGLRGGSAADRLTGDGGNNVLVGNAGNDILSGGAGDDELRGGAGNDALTGGAGLDRFVFDTTPNATSNLDTILDFVAGTDELYLSQAVFAGLASGELAADAFWSGAGVTTAHDDTDRVVYDTTSGALYYDADGTGATAAVQLAVLGTTTHPALSHADFAVTA